MSPPTASQPNRSALAAFLAGEAGGGALLIAASAAAILIVNGSPQGAELLSSRPAPAARPHAFRQARRDDSASVDQRRADGGLLLRRRAGDQARVARRAALQLGAAAACPSVAAAAGMIVPASSISPCRAASRASSVVGRSPPRPTSPLRWGCTLSSANARPLSLKLLLTTIAIVDDMGAVRDHRHCLYRQHRWRGIARRGPHIRRDDAAQSAQGDRALAFSAAQRPALVLRAALRCPRDHRRRARCHGHPDPRHPRHARCTGQPAPPPRASAPPMERLPHRAPLRLRHAGVEMQGDILRQLAAPLPFAVAMGQFAASSSAFSARSSPA